MKSISKILRYLTLIIAITILSTSCTLAKFARLGRQIEVLKIDKVEIKGTSGIKVDIALNNKSSHTLTMNDALITLKLNGDEVAQLLQVNEVVSSAHTLEMVSTLWKLEGANPMMMLLLASRIMQKDLSNMTIDFSAELSSDGESYPLSGKDVDISTFMSDFSL